jgi:thioesterase domain-containing protein
VAFEIARQLREQGESVALVALFDTYGPGYPKAMPGRSLLRSKLSDLLFRIEHHIGSLRMLSPNERLTYVLEKIYKARRRLIRLKVNSKKAIRRRRYSWFGRPLPESLLKTQDAIAEAARRYEAKVYDGRVVLLRADRQPSGIYPDPTLGWGPWVTGELNVHEVPGFHGAIVMEPRVKFVVKELTRYLEGAEAEAEPERANHSLWAQERPLSATQVDAIL